MRISRYIADRKADRVWGRALSPVQSGEARQRASFVVSRRRLSGCCAEMRAHDALTFLCCRLRCKRHCHEHRNSRLRPASPAAEAARTERLGKCRGTVGASACDPRRQDRWLLENRDALDAKIRRGLAQLDRGEGIAEAQLDARLKALKAKPR